MGLKEQQDLLARLYTDRDFSAAFFDERSGVSSSKISNDEANEIAATARDEIDLFASSLVNKRLRETEKLIPATCAFLGGELKTQFREFSHNFNPRSTKKHLDDAEQFSIFLKDSPLIAPMIKDIAKFESARLRHFSRQRKFSFCLLNHDIRPIVHQKKVDATEVLSKRRSVAAWLTFRGVTRFFFP